MLRNCTGIVIHTRPFTEHDWMVSLLTDQGERLDCVVKGVGRPHSRRRAHLNPMNWLAVELYFSPRHVYMQKLQVLHSFTHLKEHPDWVLRLYIFLEILEKCLKPKMQEPSIFLLLKETLEALEKGGQAFLPVLAQIQLARILGFLPSFKTCGYCHLHLEEEAHWDKDSKTLSCRRCRKHSHLPLPLKYRKAFEYFGKASHSDCQKIRLAPEEVRTLQEWTHDFFQSYLDKPLKSLEIQY